MPERNARNNDKLYPPGQTGEGDQITVEFLRTVRFECEGRNKGPKFVKGKKYTFDAPFAERWIKRGAAFDVRIGPPEEVEDEEERAPSLTKGGASAGADDYKAPGPGAPV
jgi:hypothetical protein